MHKDIVYLFIVKRKKMWWISYGNKKFKLKIIFFLKLRVIIIVILIQGHVNLSEADDVNNELLSF